MFYIKSIKYVSLVLDTFVPHYSNWP